MLQFYVYQFVSVLCCLQFVLFYFHLAFCVSACPCFMSDWICVFLFCLVFGGHVCYVVLWQNKTKPSDLFLPPGCSSAIQTLGGGTQSHHSCSAQRCVCAQLLWPHCVFLIWQDTLSLRLTLLRATVPSPTSTQSLLQCCTLCLVSTHCVGWP